MDPSYNDSFGSFGSNGGGSFSQSPTISSGGDIVIGGGEKKKKKWIIWVIVAAFLVVGGVCGVILILNSSRLGVSSGGVEGSFNRLGNYVISGKEDSSRIDTEYNPFEEYYFESVQNDESAREDILARTRDLLGAFTEEYENVKNKNSVTDNVELFNALIISEKEKFDLISDIPRKGLPTRMEIGDVYNSGGDVREYIRGYYGLNDLAPGSHLNEFRSAIDEWVDTETSLMQFYRNNGCPVDDPSGYLCIMKKNDNVLMSEADDLREYANYSRRGVIRYLDLSTDFVQDIFLLGKLIYHIDEE